MKTARVSVCCLAILLSWTVTSPLFAQGPPAGPPAYVPGSDDPSANDFFGPRNLQFRADIGDGVGYSKGFQTFGAFQSMVIAPNEWIFFANPRGIVTYLGDLAANVGAGTRYYQDDTDRIWGGSFWYDHDNTHERRYDQFGVSLESLGKYIDFRANGYVPTNSDREMLAQFFNGTTAFTGSNIGIGRTTINTIPLQGGDFEVGGLLPGIGNFGVRPYAGGYYYQGEGTGAVYGFRSRMEALITQDFWAQVAVTHDRLFGTNLTGAVTWYYGSGQAPRWFQRLPVQDRLYQQVERQYRITVFEEEFRDLLLALRTGGTGGSGGPIGTPITVLHVDNTAPPGGDGSVERPLNFLPTQTAPNIDIVFVNRGDGTSNRMNHGIALNNFERLLGEGVAHTFTSNYGTFALPGFTPGSLPAITNVNGDAVTLTSNNEVSGFRIPNASRNGIASAPGITNFNINNVHISEPGASGISLTNAGGTGLILDSSVNGASAAGLTIANSGDVNLDLQVVRTDLSHNNLGANVLLVGGAELTAGFLNVTANDNTLGGLRFETTESTANVAVRGSEMNLNGGFGVFASANNSIFNLIFGGSSPGQGNLVIGNHGAGLAYTLINEATGTIDIRGNRFTDTLGATGDQDAIYAGQGIDIRLNGSTDLSDATASITSGIIDGNIVTTNVGTGMLIFADQRTRLSNLTISNNTVQSNGIDGIEVFRRDQAAVTNVVITRNSIVANGDDGLQISALGSFEPAPNTYTISFNTITDNIGTGVAYFLEADANINANMFGNIIRDNGNDGIQATELVTSAQDPRGLSGLWVNNDISSNTGHGINLSARTFSLQIGQPGNPNLINDNTLDGIEINGSGTVTIDSNQIARNGSGGIDINPATFNNISILRNMIQNNLNTNGDGDGIEIFSEGPFQVIVSMEMNRIIDNAGRGVDILNRGRENFPLDGGFLTINLNANSIIGNDLEGVYVVNTASFTQLQTEPIYVPLEADGEVETDTFLDLTITNNEIAANGFRSNEGATTFEATATGFVMRVGTTGGGYSAFFDGGFASEVGTGVVARFIGNNLNGNLGDDIYIDSFTSTVDPETTEGTWTDTEFTIESYSGDPLARLDLVFNNNTFVSANVNNARGLLQSLPGASAFYDNAEATFKSRLFAEAPAPDPGPFSIATRERNAQRVSARFTLDPQVPDAPPPDGPPFTSGDFLYPGLGQSTFRLFDAVAGVYSPPTGNSDNGIFIFDDFYTSIFSANGVFNVGAPGDFFIDARPYGWNVLGGNPRPQ